MGYKAAFVAASLLSAASSAGDCGGDITPPPGAGPDVTVVALDAVHQQWGAGDTRVVTVDVDFPAEGLDYRRITAHYTLACPEGGCDPWDRTASVSVVDPATGLDVEVLRAITPYGVGNDLSLDVTDLRPILTGARQVKSYIDTWVNPGWLVTLSFEFEGGLPARRALAVQPLTRGSFTYGDPAHPIADALPAVTVTPPAGATSGVVRALTTGHGFGYTEDCAEFCKKTHTLTLGDVTDAWIPWRDDCVRAGPPGQAGTFYFSRAGWCPGDVVYPHEVDVDLRGGDAAAFQWQVEPYTNEVDGGDPYLLLSAYLISFE